MAGDVGFDQRGHEGEGQHAHEHEESAAGTMPKGFDARATSREEPTRAQGQRRTTCENDGGNLERTV